VVINSSGTVRDKHRYQAFGGSDGGSVVLGQAYRYTGKPLDEELDLDWYYYGARYYDPSIGRFPSMDPLHGKYPGWSPYAYCLNNPLRLVDPDGLLPDSDPTIFRDASADLTGRVLLGPQTPGAKLGRAGSLKAGLTVDVDTKGCVSAGPAAEIGIGKAIGLASVEASAKANTTIDNSGPTNVSVMMEASALGAFSVSGSITHDPKSGTTTTEFDAKAQLPSVSAGGDKGSTSINMPERKVTIGIYGLGFLIGFELDVAPSTPPEPSQTSSGTGEADPQHQAGH